MALSYRARPQSQGRGREGWCTNVVEAEGEMKLETWSTSTARTAARAFADRRSREPLFHLTRARRHNLQPPRI